MAEDTISFRLNHEDRERLDAHVRETGQTRSVWLRELVLAALAGQEEFKGASSAEQDFVGGNQDDASLERVLKELAQVKQALVGQRDSLRQAWQELVRRQSSSRPADGSAVAEHVTQTIETWRRETDGERSKIERRLGRLRHDVAAMASAFLLGYRETRQFTAEQAKEWVRRNFPLE